MKRLWNDILSDPDRKAEYLEEAAQRNSRVGALLEFDPDMRADAGDGRHATAAGGAAGGAVGEQARVAGEPGAARAVDGGDAAAALAGLPVAVKDNIAVRGFHLTCGSRLLEQFVCPYDATAVERLVARGVRVVGKSSLDEFGMGSATDTSPLGTAKNPWDTDRTAGGSSGGSAAAVAAGIVPAALGSDTGGSVRQPAAFCGVYGLKPTYGAVSRYGLVAYASSLDTVGIIGDTVDRTRRVFDAIRGADPLDQTSRDIDGVAGEAAPADGGVGGDEDNTGGRSRRASSKEASSKLKIDDLSVAVLAGDLGLDAAVADGYEHTRETLAELGAKVSEVQLSCLEFAAAVYYTIATAEASANLARFDGVRYGRRPPYAENPDELVRAARSAGLGDEVKLRILLGTYVLRSGFHDQYYGRAQRLRRRITEEISTLFATHDIILAPVFPTAAFPLGSAGLDPYRRKIADRFTTLANLTGIPALTIPAGVAGGLPVGMQLMGPAGSEHRLLSVAEQLAGIMPPSVPSDFPRIWS